MMESRQSARKVWAWLQVDAPLVWLILTKVSSCCVMPSGATPNPCKSKYANTTHECVLNPCVFGLISCALDCNPVPIKGRPCGNAWGFKHVMTTSHFQSGIFAPNTFIQDAFIYGNVYIEKAASECFSLSHHEVKSTSALILQMNCCLFPKR